MIRFLSVCLVNLSAADESPSPAVALSDPHMMQKECVHRLLLEAYGARPGTRELRRARNDFWTDRSTDFLEWLDTNPNDSFVDDFYGIRVTCRDGLITHLIINNQSMGKIRYAWAPPTVEVLKIEFCSQRFVLNPKLLPPRAHAISFHYNNIFGTLDLGALPDMLETFGAADNKIVGPISLTELPPRLRSLNLRDNLIVQDVVQVANVPSLCRIVRLAGNQIGGFEAVFEDEDINWTIFELERETGKSGSWFDTIFSDGVVNFWDV